ncbi:hypothetical protein Anas_06821, partial [Armadillidium nasatum]
GGNGMSYNNKNMINFIENEKEVSQNTIVPSTSEIYEETTEEIVSFNTSCQNVVGSESQIQIPQFQESYEEVMTKIGPSSSTSSFMLADPNPQRSHLQDEKNEHQIENEKEVSQNTIIPSTSEIYEETTEEIVSFNTSCQNVVGSESQIQIPQFQESYEEVMTKIGPSSSTSSFMLADLNPQRSHLQDEKNEHQIENEKEVSQNTIVPSTSEIYQETTEEIVSFNTSCQNVVGSESQIQIPQFQESYEEVMTKIGPSSSTSSFMLADLNPQRSHLQDEKNEHQIENEKEVSQNTIVPSTSEIYEETTKEIVSFNTSCQNVVGSESQIQIPQFQESYEEVMTKIGPSSSTSSFMLADPNPQRSHLQDETNEHQIGQLNIVY